jgi:pimeloyl-ACP methyl ester carboxylesterase
MKITLSVNGKRQRLELDPRRHPGASAVCRPAGPCPFDVRRRAGRPAWKSLPSWYLVAQGDEAIPPEAERMFAARMSATTIEIPSGHAAMVSHPKEVVRLIEKAAEAVGSRAASYSAEQRR